MFDPTHPGNAHGTDDVTLHPGNAHGTDDVTLLLCALLTTGGSLRSPNYTPGGGKIVPRNYRGMYKVLIYSEEEEFNSQTRNSDGIMPLQPGADMAKQGVNILMGVANHQESKLSL